MDPKDKLRVKDLLSEVFRNGINNLVNYELLEYYFTFLHWFLDELSEDHFGLEVSDLIGNLWLSCVFVGT